MTYKVYRVFILFLLCSVFTAGAFAQNANSSVRGTVQDTHGAIVPDATVTLTNVGTNQSLTTTIQSGWVLHFCKPRASEL